MTDTQPALPGTTPPTPVWTFKLGEPLDTVLAKVRHAMTLGVWPNRVALDHNSPNYVSAADLRTRGIPARSGLSSRQIWIAGAILLSPDGGTTRRTCTLQQAYDAVVKQITGVAR